MLTVTFCFCFSLLCSVQIYDGCIETIRIDNINWEQQIHLARLIWMHTAQVTPGHMIHAYDLCTSLHDVAHWQKQKQWIKFKIYIYIIIDWQQHKSQVKFWGEKTSLLNIWLGNLIPTAWYIDRLINAACLPFWQQQNSTTAPHNANITRKLIIR